MAGVGGALEVAPAIIVCGLSFAGVQFYVSNYIGPELTDILSSLTCIGAMVLVLKLWKPRNIFRLAGDKPVSASVPHHTPAEILSSVAAVHLARHLRVDVGLRADQGATRQGSRC